MSLRGAVVVGVDGSPESLRALDWAAVDAARRERPLHIVYAVPPPLLYAPLTAPVLPVLYDEPMIAAAEHVLADAADRAERTSFALDVGTEVLHCPATMALLEASRDAATVVVGTRGLSALAGVLLGSVGTALAAHADCPVVVVRPPAEHPAREAGRVLVGIADATTAACVLRFAFEEAATRGVGLTAVHASMWPQPGAADSDVLGLAAYSRQYPSVDLRRRVAPGRAAPVLAELSAGAELLVVGTRCRGTLTGLLMGSVSQSVIHHADCPVAVVR